MSGDYASFAAWLRERATSVGFDLDARGGIAKLAAASGIDPAQMSRALRGLAVPAIEGQRGLARALHVKLPEVMIRAGSAEPADFPASWGLDDNPAPPLSSHDVEQIWLRLYAVDYRIEPEDLPKFTRLVKAIAAEMGHGPANPV